MSVTVQQEILRLQITIDDVLGVKVVQGAHYFTGVKVT